MSEDAGGCRLPFTPAQADQAAAFARELYERLLEHLRASMPAQVARAPGAEAYLALLYAPLPHEEVSMLLAFAVLRDFRAELDAAEAAA